MFAAAFILTTCLEAGSKYSFVPATLRPSNTLDNSTVEEEASLDIHGTQSPRNYHLFMLTLPAAVTYNVSFSTTSKRAALNAGPIDWRSRGAVTKPTSQGRCSTCAYFAGVAAVEGAWKLAGHPLVKLSEQEEIDCYNNGGYAMPNMVHGIARAVDAPLANHSDPNITGCRGITNCSHAKSHSFAWINGTRGSKSHNDLDVLALLQSGPAAVSVDAGPYNGYPSAYVYTYIRTLLIAK